MPSPCKPHVLFFYGPPDRSIRHLVHPSPIYCNTSTKKLPKTLKKLFTASKPIWQFLHFYAIFLQSESK